MTHNQNKIYQNIFVNNLWQTALSNQMQYIICSCITYHTPNSCFVHCFTCVCILIEVLNPPKHYFHPSLKPSRPAEKCNLSSEHDQKHQTDEAPGWYPGQMPELPLMAKVLS